MNGNPEITVVMATYNRADTLPRTLDHLAKQDLAPDRFEVVVVDDASPDDTARVLAEQADSVPFELRFLVNEENRGPGYTENRGIREARAPLLLIIADDIFLAPGALRAHLEFHREHPAAEATALGTVLQSEELRDTALLRNWDPFRFWLLEDAGELPFYMFWACNVSCKREFMLEKGMFLEHRGRAGPVAFEDLELGYRLGLAGMRLRYLAEGLGYHYHPYTMEGAISRWHLRGLNYAQFRRLVPEPLLDVYFHVLNRDTARGYFRVLRSENPFEGAEASAAYHVFRHGVQTLLLNRFTARWIWRPILDAAERSPRIERLVSRQMYRAFFYYHFLRGVREAKRRFAESDA